MGNTLLLRRAEKWNTQWWCFDAASRRQLCSWFDFDSILCGSQRHHRKRAFVVEKWGSHSSEFWKKQNRTCSNSYSSTFLVCFFHETRYGTVNWLWEVLGVELGTSTHPTLPLILLSCCSPPSRLSFICFFSPGFFDCKWAQLACAWGGEVGWGKCFFTN